MAKSWMYFLGIMGFSSALWAQSPQWEAGKALFEHSCAGCHGVDGRGDIGRPLAGQPARDIIQKMKAYRAGKIHGFNASLMTLRARNLTDEQIKAVATYIDQSLKI